MKKITLLLGVLLSWATTSQAQTGVQVGVKAGLSRTVLDGTLNENADFRSGFHVGAVLRWRPTAHFAFQPEVVYAQQGCKTNSDNGGTTFENEIKTAYLNVPLLAKVYIGKIFNVQVGPQLGLLLAARRVGQVSYSSTTGYNSQDIDVKQNYKSDVALCGGLGIDLPMGLTAAARLNYGLSDINNNEREKQARDYYGIGGLHNRALEFSLGYMFGGK